MSAVAWRIMPGETLFLMGSSITDDADVAEMWRKAGCSVEPLMLVCERWRPIAEFKMPEMTKANFYDRHRMLFQMGRRGDTLPWVCEGYAQLALTGKRPNQRAVPRFYGAAGQWLGDGVEFFMPLPEPRT